MAAYQSPQKPPEPEKYTGSKDPAKQAAAPKKPAPKPAPKPVYSDWAMI